MCQFRFLACLFAVYVALANVGCRLLFEIAEPIEIENCSDEFRAYDVVVETRAQTTESEIAVQLDMTGAMRWLRLYDKYCGSSKEWYGSWFDWMWHDNDVIAFIRNDGLYKMDGLKQGNRFIARLSVPAYGAYARKSYLKLFAEGSHGNWFKSDVQRLCGSWGNARFDSVELADGKVEIRLRVILYPAAKLVVSSRSASIDKLRIDRCDYDGMKFFGPVLDYQRRESVDMKDQAYDYDARVSRSR